MGVVIALLPHRPIEHTLIDALRKHPCTPLPLHLFLPPYAAPGRTYGRADEA